MENKHRPANAHGITIRCRARIPSRSFPIRHTQDTRAVVFQLIYTDTQRRRIKRESIKDQAIEKQGRAEEIRSELSSSSDIIFSLYKREGKKKTKK